MRHDRTVLVTDLDLTLVDDEYARQVIAKLIDAFACRHRARLKRRHQFLDHIGCQGIIGVNGFQKSENLILAQGHVSCLLQKLVPPDMTPDGTNLKGGGSPHRATRQNQLSDPEPSQRRAEREPTVPAL